MKYFIYPLAIVIALSGISLGVASAANDGGIPGVVNKLDEIKAVLLDLSTTTEPFPSEIDVNVVSPDPIDVNIVGGSDGGTDYEVIAISEDDVVSDGTVYEVETAGWQTIYIHKSIGGCVWRAEWEIDGLIADSFSLPRMEGLTSRDVTAEKLILTSTSCNGTQRGDVMKAYLKK